jgi:formylglycine-generating enzyme required for sulfatase activity
MDSPNNDSAMPVNSATWANADQFCRKLTEKESSILKGKIYSLPTVKEWDEFRAGQKLEELQSGKLRSGSQLPLPVTESGTNKLGLFGVLGNVWEWCSDGGSDSAKLQKGGDLNDPKYDRLVNSGNARRNSGFRCVLK